MTRRRIAMLEDWLAAEMLIVLWREKHYQLCWTQVVIEGVEHGKYLDIKIQALEGHGIDRRRMRLWHHDYQIGLKRLTKAARDAVLGYIERRWHEVVIMQNMTTGEHEIMADTELDRTMQIISEWLGSADATTVSGVVPGWYKLKEWHYVKENGVTLCRAYQIIATGQPEAKPGAGGICQICKKRVP